MNYATPALSSANLNALAKMVSNAGLQRMMFADNFRRDAKQMKKLLKKTGIEVEDKSTFSELIEISYNHLLVHYRHEYLYKIALLNSYVLKNYSLSDTILLNEFKIGNSKADTILVNGTNKVFEIKTELDSPERLITQINDYYKGFSEVYIVIHHSAIDKYINLINSNVGIMVFSEQNTIETFRIAKNYYDSLDVIAMMKALRKEEYLMVVKQLTGDVPDVPPIHLFKACLNVLSPYDRLEVQSEFLKTIKRRINNATNDLVQSPKLPDIMRFSCYHYNINQNDYLGLIERLNSQL